MPSSNNAGQGWHQRALGSSFTSPQDFQPSLSDLKFALLRNAPVETEGFTAAVFKSDASDAQPVVVDVMGRVLNLAPRDYDALVAAAKRVVDSGLPDTGFFRNTWMVERPITSQFIERLLVFDGSSYKETSVQGFQPDDTVNKLKKPVEGIENLPREIADFFALGLEAQEDRQWGEENQLVVEKVKAILPEGVY